MQYQIDHDLHIHSFISPCAGHDPRQTPAAILAYGVTAGLCLVCVTDHIWDKNGPGDCMLWRGDGLDFEKAESLLPLPLPVRHRSRPRQRRQSCRDGKGL